MAAAGRGASPGPTAPRSGAGRERCPARGSSAPDTRAPAWGRGRTRPLGPRTRGPWLTLQAPRPCPPGLSGRAAPGPGRHPAPLLLLRPLATKGRAPRSGAEPLCSRSVPRGVSQVQVAPLPAPEAPCVSRVRGTGGGWWRPGAWWSALPRGPRRGSRRPRGQPPPRGLRPALSEPGRGAARPEAFEGASRVGLGGSPSRLDAPRGARPGELRGGAGRARGGPLLPAGSGFPGNLAENDG